MTNQEIIEILVAHSNGKQIQIRKMGTQQGFRDGKWYDVENPRWNFEDNDYRVAPEPPKPREWWLDQSGIALRVWNENEKFRPSNLIHVREVIE